MVIPIVKSGLPGPCPFSVVLNNREEAGSGCSPKQRSVVGFLRSLKYQ